MNIKKLFAGIALPVVLAGAGLISHFGNSSPKIEKLEKVSFSRLDVRHSGALNDVTAFIKGKGTLTDGTRFEVETSVGSCESVLKMVPWKPQDSASISSAWIMAAAENIEAAAGKKINNHPTELNYAIAGNEARLACEGMKTNGPSGVQ